MKSDWQTNAGRESSACSYTPKPWNWRFGEQKTASLKKNRPYQVLFDLQAQLILPSLYTINPYCNSKNTAGTEKTFSTDARKKLWFFIRKLLCVRISRQSIISTGIIHAKMINGWNKKKKKIVEMAIPESVADITKWKGIEIMSSGRGR